MWNVKIDMKDFKIDSHSVHSKISKSPKRVAFTRSQSYSTGEYSPTFVIWFYFSGIEIVLQIPAIWIYTNVVTQTKHGKNWALLISYISSVASFYYFCFSFHARFKGKPLRIHYNCSSRQIKYRRAALICTLHSKLCKTWNIFYCLAWAMIFCLQKITKYLVLKVMIPWIWSEEADTQI